MKPFELFKDSDGRDCQLILEAVSDETGEKLLVYQRLQNPGVFHVGKAELNSDLEIDETEADEFDASVPEDFQPEEAGDASEEAAVPEQETEQEQMDPDIARFLDAETMEEKMEVLLSMREHITNDEIDTLAMSLGISIDEGNVEDRFDELRECLNLIARYELENSRLR